MRETGKPLIYVAADLAAKRKERGLKLDYGETAALVGAALPEGRPRRHGLGRRASRGCGGRL